MTSVEFNSLLITKFNYTVSGKRARARRGRERERARARARARERQRQRNRHTETHGELVTFPAGLLRSGVDNRIAIPACRRSPACVCRRHLRERVLFFYHDRSILAAAAPP